MLPWADLTICMSRVLPVNAAGSTDATFLRSMRWIPLSANAPAGMDVTFVSQSGRYQRSSHPRKAPSPMVTRSEPRVTLCIPDPLKAPAPMVSAFRALTWVRLGQSLKASSPMVLTLLEKSTSTKVSYPSKAPGLTVSQSM